MPKRGEEHLNFSNTLKQKGKGKNRNKKQESKGRQVGTPNEVRHVDSLLAFTTTTSTSTQYYNLAYQGYKK